MNDLFKLMSLRRSMPGLSIEPGADLAESSILTRVSALGVDWQAPSREVVALIARIPVISAGALRNSVLHQLVGAIDAKKTNTLQALAAVVIETPGAAHLGLREFIAGADAHRAYLRVVESWWIHLLRGDAEAARLPLEPLIRRAYIAASLGQRDTLLAQPGAIANLLSARIVVPVPWTRSAGEHQRDRDRDAASLRDLPPVTVSSRTQALKQARLQQSVWAGRIRSRQAIQLKAHALAGRHKSRSVQEPIPTEGAGGFVLSTGTFFGKLTDAIAPPQPVMRGRSRVSAIVVFDTAFYDKLQASFTPAEAEEFEQTLGPAGFRPGNLGELLPVFDEQVFIDPANEACAGVRVWEDDEDVSSPPPGPATASTDLAAVRAIGWADLIVARERVVAYEAHEVAHIENVMAGEKKVREHERIHRTEEVVETETFQSSESETEMKTSERQELQSKSESTIAEEFSIDSGIDTSGRYGLTKLDSSLDVGFAQSSSESQSSSVRLAKEITSRAVERVFQSARDLRRTSVFEQVRESNVHTIDNTAQGSGPAPSANSGIYLWVDQVRRVELRQYGQRLMIEFHIPEPALSLLEESRPPPISARRPAPLSVGPADISEANYLCLTRLYGLVDVEPPPPLFVHVGWAWASMPSESDNENKSEDTVADMLKVPTGYAPVTGRAVVSAHPAQAQFVDVFAAVGGHPVINVAGTSFGESDFDFDPQDTWPQGVPISIRAHGHFDKTLTAQISLHCLRTPNAYRTWQLRTYESLRQAHQIMVREHQRALEQAREDMPEALFGIDSAPAQSLRTVEREELQKWAIKALRHPHQFQFNAVESVGDLQEIATGAAALQAPIVRFFEGAFEWRQMSYFTYPYYWSRREAWPVRHRIEHPDARHQAFLRAGAARVIVPVTPGYESRVLSYLEPSQANELERVTAAVPDSEMPAHAEAADLWLELLLQQHEDRVIGSGTLSVTAGEAEVAINPDSQWQPSAADIGRELQIGSGSYRVAALLDAARFTLDEPYRGTTDPQASFANGSVAFGLPWTVRTPTGMVVLEEERDRLPAVV